MRSDHAGTPASLVLAAGLGLRHGQDWALRSASFRMEAPAAGGRAAGIATADPAAATAVVDLLAGRTPPSYGELRVLGQDLTTPAGRAAVRGQIGVARMSSAPWPGRRVRGLVWHAAGTARLSRPDRRLLTAAILDKLELTGWADVPLRAAPGVVARRARLAAAAVHEPNLLLLDGMLDDLTGRDTETLADAIRTLARETAVIATGSQAETLALACDDIITLDDGILVSYTDPAGLFP